MIYENQHIRDKRFEQDDVVSDCVLTNCDTGGALVRHSVLKGCDWQTSVIHECRISCTVVIDDEVDDG